MFTYPWQHEHSPWLDILLGTGWQQTEQLVYAVAEPVQLVIVLFVIPKEILPLQFKLMLFKLPCNLYNIVIYIVLQLILPCHLNYHCNLNSIVPYINELCVFSHTVNMLQANWRQLTFTSDNLNVNFGAFFWQWHQKLCHGSLEWTVEDWKRIPNI
jgi:hypothetical protein